MTSDPRGRRPAATAGCCSGPPPGWMRTDSGSRAAVCCESSVARRGSARSPSRRDDRRTMAPTTRVAKPMQPLDEWPRGLQGAGQTAHVRPPTEEPGSPERRLDERDVGVDHEAGQLLRRRSRPSSPARRSPWPASADERVGLVRPLVAVVVAHVLLPVEARRGRTRSRRTHAPWCRCRCRARRCRGRRAAASATCPRRTPWRSPSRAPRRGCRGAARRRGRA